MFDYKSSLPIKNSSDSLNGYDELQVKTKAGTALDVKTATGEYVEVQQATHDNLKANVTVTDGTNDVTVTNVGAKYGLDVNVIEGINVEVDLSHNDDSVLIYGYDGTTNQPIATNNQGEVKLDETTLATLATEATLSDIRTAIQIIDDWDDGADNAKVNIQDISSIVGQTTKVNSIPVVIASDQDVLDVNVVSSVATSPVTTYNTQADVAAGTTHTFTFTDWGAAAGKLQQVHASASGPIKVEVKVGAPASEATVRVGFNSSANPNVDLIFEQEIDVASGDNVLVEITNTHVAKAFDVYADIGGFLS